MSPLETNRVLNTLHTLLGDGEEKLELRGELLLRVEAVREVQAADAAVGMHLHTKGLNVVGAVGATGEVGEVELDLVPALVKTHGHGADEGLDAGRRLVVGGAEAAADALVVEDLDLEGEVLLEVLDDHDEEGQLDAKGLVGIGGAGDEAGVDIAADELKDGGLDVLVGQSLDVAVADLLVPDLEGAGADAIEDREEAGLESVLEHGYV